MSINRWHIYEAMKKRWRESQTVMTVMEVVTAFPGANFEELTEGMAEFKIVHQRSFSKEKWPRPKHSHLKRVK